MASLHVQHITLLAFKYPLVKELLVPLSKIISPPEPSWIELVYCNQPALRSDVHCFLLCRSLAQCETKVKVWVGKTYPMIIKRCVSMGRPLDVFGIGSLKRIPGYRWSDHLSNERILRESRMRPITCMIRERQMRLCILSCG